MEEYNKTMLYKKIKRRIEIAFLLVVAITEFQIQGCTFALKQTRYTTMDALMEARTKNNPPVNSIKALASVDLKVHDKGAEFPEAIIISKNAMRLETLNIFYQPVLVVVYNDKAAVLDVNTGVCSVGSADILYDYTQVDIKPELFEKLITGQLVGMPATFTAFTKNIVVTGKHDGFMWISELNSDLAVMSTAIEGYNNDLLTCTYKDHESIDGVAFPMHVACEWGKNKLVIHYRKLKVNVKVEPLLVDPDRLCERQ